ncbi:MAG: YbhB/YbcL family Raf kinase inhibitor-like protein, partial [Nanoarchaeota archaeon]
TDRDYVPQPEPQVDVPTATPPDVSDLPSTDPSFTLESYDFYYNTPIPKRLTCQGEDISPHLKWTDPPQGTESFAVSVFDPDARQEGWTHWLLIDIPVDQRVIEKGSAAGTEIENDFGRLSYGGPCPPEGKHRYIFTVYALDVPSLDGVTKENFFDVVPQHALASAKTIGLYQKS